ncbi:hypothetical protein AB0942_33185 [Streptomyces nodosus]|uniref:hypothetical protein n=1 Tax=Streptomyces nodosus TaxID=40318 RepID=UPI00345428F5
MIYRLGRHARLQTISEVTWRGTREITPEAYHKDMRYAEALGFRVHRHGVKDRDGRFMVVVWVATGGRRGRQVACYEIAGRV